MTSSRSLGRVLLHAREKRVELHCSVAGKHDARQPFDHDLAFSRAIEARTLADAMTPISLANRAATRTASPQCRRATNSFFTVPFATCVMNQGRSTPSIGRPGERVRLAGVERQVLVDCLRQVDVVQLLPLAAKRHPVDREAVPQEGVSEVREVVLMRNAEPELVVLGVPEPSAVATECEHRRAAERGTDEW